MKKLIFLLCPGIFLLSACGMATKGQAKKFSAAYKAGKYMEACTISVDKKLCTDETTEETKKLIEKEGLDEKLNAATSLFNADKHNMSYELFADAAEKIQSQRGKGVVSKAGAAVVGIVANDSLLGYESYVMDGLYASAYQILNLLAQNDLPGARVEVNRAYEKQQEAAQNMKKEIAKKQDKESLEQKEAINQALAEYQDLAKWKGYEDYLNPYTTYLSGIFFLSNASGSSDYETASTYLKRVVGMSENNSFAKKTLEKAKRAANGNASKLNTLWVVFENGLVANLEEFRLDLPVFLVTKEVKTVSFAFPKPHERELAYSNLTISNGKEVVETETLANVDSMFISEFKQRLPLIITKQVIKMAAQTAAQAAAQKNGGLLGGIGAAAYSVLTAGADTRSWYSLPKEVQIAEIDKTANNEDFTIFANGQILGQINIPAEGNHILYIRIPKAGAKPNIALLKI